jgi:dipeptidyl aminopeptidase/acylaminoacyl peptidase
MIEALIQAKQHFELMLYPGKTHGISGPVDQTDVYNRIKAHFERTLLDKPASEQVTK